MDIRNQRIMDVYNLKRFSMQALVDKTGLGERSIKNILDGYCSVSDEVLMKFAYAFDVSPEYLMGLTDFQMVEETSRRAVPVFRKSINYSVVTDPATVEENMYITVPKSDKFEYFAIYAKDNSMIRSRILEEDKVLIRKQTTKSSGDVLFVKVGPAEPELYKYQKTGETQFLYKDSQNRDEKPIFFNDNDERVKIIGKVVQVIIGF